MAVVVYAAVAFVGAVVLVVGGGGVVVVAVVVVCFGESLKSIYTKLPIDRFAAVTGSNIKLSLCVE